MNFKRSIFLFTVFCILVTGLAVYLLGGIDAARLQIWLKQAGVWSPIIYMILYTSATVLILPSTPLNLTGGAIFGPWWGTLWTSIAALIAAVVAFTFTRTVGRKTISQKLAGRWQAMEAEIDRGALFYMFAIRLLPIIPYGLVNFAAGLTSIRFRDYLIGTMLGTVPGVLPFVMIGSSGLNAAKTGNVLPLAMASGLAGSLVGVATWYRRRQSPQAAIKEKGEQLDRRDTD